MLARPRALAGDPDVPVLRRLHLAAGLATVAVVGLLEAGGAWRPALWPTVALLGAAIVAVTVLGDPRTAWEDRATTGARVAAALAIGVAALAVLAAAVAVAVDTPAPAGRAGLDQACAVLVVAVVAALGVLLVANAVVARGRARPDEGDGRFAPFAHGLAATVVAALGVFLGIGYTGAAAFGTAKLVEAAATAPLVVPEMFSRAVYAWGLTHDRRGGDRGRRRRGLAPAPRGLPAAGGGRLRGGRVRGSPGRPGSARSGPRCGSPA